MLIGNHALQPFNNRYESGPGYSVGGEKPGSKGLNTLIEASRDPGMKDVVVYDVRETCWRHGWDVSGPFAFNALTPVVFFCLLFN